MPLNLTDPASGVDYFTAARQLIDAYNAAGGDVGQMGRIPYWENMFPDAAFDGFTATQNMAAEFGGVNPDYITALYNADQFCFPACSRFGPIRVLRGAVRLARRAELDRALRVRRDAADPPAPVQPTATSST